MSSFFWKHYAASSEYSVDDYLQDLGLIVS